MRHNEMNLPHLPRKFWRRPASVLALAACLSWAVVWPAVAQPCYRVVDLGEIGFTAGADDTFGINNANQAVFTAVVGGKKHAMLYLPVGAYDLAAGVHDLHTLAGAAIDDESAAHDINADGIVVGWAGIEVSPSTFEQHAFVWRLDKDPFEFIDLGTFFTGDSSTAFGINNDAPFPIVVGDGNLLFDCACDPDPPFNNLIRRAFALELRDPPDPLIQAALLVQDPSLPCQPNTWGRDVKSLAALTVAGFSTVGGEDCAAPFGCGVGNAGTAWIDPAPGNNAGNALALLPDGPFGPGGTQAWGVSDTGAIVGYGYTASNAPCKQHAVYWHTDIALPLDLGSIAGAGDQSRAMRINNETPAFTTLQVAGWGLAFPTRPLLWECDAACNLLANWDVTEINGSLISPCHFEPDPDWEIHKLFDVNNDGWLIGTGSLAGVAHGVVLAPMAECAPAVCQGDIDGDGDVGVLDLLILLGSWGLCPAPPATCFADLDCDGAVGVTDNNILLGNWGSCPGGGSLAAVEEAVQQMGHGGLTAYEAWLSQVPDEAARAAGYVLYALLEGQE